MFLFTETIFTKKYHCSFYIFFKRIISFTSLFDGLCFSKRYYKQKDINTNNIDILRLILPLIQYFLPFNIFMMFHSIISIKIDRQLFQELVKIIMNTKYVYRYNFIEILYQQQQIILIKNIYIIHSLINFTDFKQLIFIKIKLARFSRVKSILDNNSLMSLLNCSFLSIDILVVILLNILPLKSDDFISYLPYKIFKKNVHILLSVFTQIEMLDLVINYLFFINNKEFEELMNIFKNAKKMYLVEKCYLKKLIIWQDINYDKNKKLYGIDVVKKEKKLMKDPFNMR